MRVRYTPNTSGRVINAIVQTSGLMIRKLRRLRLIVTEQHICGDSNKTITHTRLTAAGRALVSKATAA